MQAYPPEPDWESQRADRPRPVLVEDLPWQTWERVEGQLKEQLRVLLREALERMATRVVQADAQSIRRLPVLE
jgi:hypothetical protein